MRAVMFVVLCSSVASADPTCGCEVPQPSRLFVLGWGLGGASRVGNVAPSGGELVTVRSGQRIADRFHLIESMNLGFDFAYSPDPTMTEAHSSITVGVRWSPFPRRPQPNRSYFIFPLLPDGFVEPYAFYVELAGGLSIRERGSPTMGSSSSAFGPMTSLGIAHMAFQGHDWAFGEEFREELAHHSDGFQRLWSLSLLLQVSN